MLKFTLVLMVSSIMGVSAAALAGSTYSPPQIAQGKAGNESYIEPKMLDRSNTTGLIPELTSPEGAVVLFLASRIRRDRAWQDSLVDDRSHKLSRRLDEWSDWTLNRAQLQSRKLHGDHGCVTVWFDLTVNGQNITGSDEFTVKLVNGEWRIAEVPS